MKEQTYVCQTLAEIKNATSNLDKAVEVPLKIDDGGVLKDVEKFKGIYNVSKGKFAAAVVNHYQLVSHKQYFDSFAEALNRLGLNFTMEITQQGNRAFADIEFKGRNIKYDKLNEEFTTGIRLINSYDKTTGLFVVPRFTRLACMNGMIISAYEKVVSVKHIDKSIREIEGFVEGRISAIINARDDLKGWVSESMKDSIEWKMACRIIGKLFDQLKHREKILQKLGVDVVIVTDKKTNKKSVSYVWTDKSKMKAKFNRWDMYNAVTSYLTHGEHITPHVENVLQKKAQRLLLTPLAKLPMEKGVI